MKNHLCYGDNLKLLRDRAVRLPARRDDAFRKARREGGGGRQRSLDI